MAPCPTAEANETLLVLTSQSSPYLQAARSCQTKLEEAGIYSKSILIENLTPEKISTIDGPVISFGAGAAIKLIEHMPSTTALYYCMVSDPERAGLTKRTNTSGVSTAIPLANQIQTIQDGIPSARKFGILYRSTSQDSMRIIEKLQSTIPSNWELIAIDLDSAPSASKAIKDLLRRKLDMVWTLPDTTVYNSATIKALLLESLHQSIPVFGFSHALVRAGATLGVGIEPKEQGELAAQLCNAQRLDEHLSPKSHVAINEIAAKRIRLRFSKPFIANAQVNYH